MPSLDQAALEDHFRVIGLVPGMLLEVHSALSRFGWVDGGAGAVVRALNAAVSPGGTLVMSAYPLTKVLPLTDADRALGLACKVRLLDPDSREPTGMGAVADAFRGWPGVRLGPGFHRVAAWGRQAEAVCQPGAGYGYLLDHGGWTLLLGVDIHRCSAMHHAEALVPLPPGPALTIPPTVLAAYPPEQWYVEVEPPAPVEDVWGQVQDEADRLGLLRHRTIGQSPCLLFPTAPVVGLYAARRRAVLERRKDAG